MVDGTHGERTKAAILAAGVRLWGETCVPPGASAIGKALGLTHSAVLYHFRAVAPLQDAIAAEAVRLCDAKVVPLLIASRNPAAATLSSVDRRRYMSGC